MDKFQFDEMEVNTDLAKEYFKKNNYKFPNNPKYSNNVTEKDGYNNSIFYTQSFSGHPRTKALRNMLTNKCIFEQEEKLKKLAVEIEKNAKTFCQIEYLIRNIPIDEVKQYDIKLIVQYLLCGVQLSQNNSIIELNEDSPLLHLGLAAQESIYFNEVVIVATKNTAAVSKLFTELCRGVGLINIKTVFDKPVPKASSIDTKQGCIGVVTERCDVDSAVHTFLDSTTRYEWKLSRVYVQESVYDSFKKTFAWKTNSQSEQAVVSTECCASAYSYHGKKFLVDFVGNVEASPGILIEAYRTTKELLSLLQRDRAQYLSLWASDISQANEIAYNVPSTVVWVNSYGVFDGPPHSSLSIYSELILRKPMVSIRAASLDSLLRSQEVWARLDFEDRRRVVQGLTFQFTKGEDDEDVREFFEGLQRALRNTKSGHFAHVDKDRVCVGISEPVKVIRLAENSIDEVTLIFELLARSLTNGSAVIFESDNPDFPSNWTLKRYFELLATRVPVAVVDPSGDEVPGYDAQISALVRTRVVWTNYGTIFAN